VLGRVDLGSSAVVDLTAMAECGHGDEEDVVVDAVDDAVGADANAEPGSSLQCGGAGWSWVLAEEGDRAADAVTVLMVYST
jgi:hypothetical protein